MSTEKNKVRTIAEWVVGLQYEDIPKRIIEKAKQQIFSVLGAAHAGYLSEGGQNLVQTVRQWGNPGKCTIIPCGDKSSMHNALLVNASLSCVHDYDDYLFMGHTGHSAVMASLALCEEEGLTFKDMVTAQVIASEVEGRLGASVMLGPQNGQLWTFIHLAGGACIGGKLLKLTVEQMENALGIALSQPNFALWPGFMGSQSKILVAGTTSVGGIQAAQLARNGMTGPTDILDNPGGFYSQFSYYPLKAFISGFGQAWVTDTIAFKIYPGCAYIDTTIDALLEILKKYEAEKGKKLLAEDVGEIIIEASRLTTEMEALSHSQLRERLSPININFSIPLNVAITVLAGRLTVEELDQEELDRNDKAIRELASRVKLTHDLSFTLNLTSHFYRAIDLGRLLAGLRLKDIRRIISRSRTQYAGDLGLGLRELPVIWRKLPPDMKEKIKSGIRKALLSLLNPQRGKDKKPYDLGDYNLEKVTLPFSARVTLKTGEGKTFTAQQDIPYGAQGHPPEEIARQVEDKFVRESSRLLSPDQVKQAVKLIKDLPLDDKVEKLTEAACLRKS
ncbi:MAG: MmgE/PrpD family protein [Deltaproteobacteria bacterium]|nr:MAG: MmgE/PrpD family protein [Deltaproteobacteria bacterium]